MNRRFRNSFPYILILVTIPMSYLFSQVMKSLDFDGYYGKTINSMAYDFKLMNSRGKDVSLSDLKGKPTFITFGFTQCSTTCPTNLMTLQRLSYKLKQENISSHFLFISIDEIRDTKKKLKRYTELFKITGLQGLRDGEESSLYVARKFFNYIDYNKKEAKGGSNYQIRHNGFIYFVDEDGKLALIYTQNRLDENKVIEDIKKLKRDKKLKG